MKSNIFSRDQVKRIAHRCGYEEQKVSESDQNYKVKLVFSHPHKRGCGGCAKEYGPARVTVFLSTGNTTTYLDHPKAGKGQMYRGLTDVRSLERVFDNPRVHSNVGYKEKEETRRKHREQGLNCYGIEQLARGYGAVLTTKNKISLEYGDHQGVRVRIWFRTGTIGLANLETEKQNEIYMKHSSIDVVRRVLQDPKKVLQEQLMHHSDRPPLAAVDPSSVDNIQNNNTLSSTLVGTLDAAAVKAIGEKWDYTFKESSPTLYQLQLEKAPGRGKVTVNIHREKSTVLVQKQNIRNQVSFRYLFCLLNKWAPF